MQEWWLAVDISAWGHNLISQGIPRIGGFSFIANITYTKFKEALHTESLVEKFPLINCKTITKLRAVFSSSFINLDRLEIKSIRRKLIGLPGSIYFYLACMYTMASIQFVIVMNQEWPHSYLGGLACGFQKFNFCVSAKLSYIPSMLLKCWQN